MALDYDRSFTRQPTPNVQTTSQERKPDPEVVTKRDDLYARAWEFESEKPIFDDDQNELSPPIPRKVVVESDHTHAKTCITPGAERESSPEFFSSTDG